MSEWGGPSSPSPQGPPPGPGRRGGCRPWMLAALGLLAAAAVVAAFLVFGGARHETSEPPIPGASGSGSGSGWGGTESPGIGGSGSEWGGPSAPRE